MTAFAVLKRDVHGQVVLSYQGVLFQRGEDFVCIDAEFAQDDRDLGYILLRRGDCFREWFYADRYFNIFRIRDVETRQLKGWYCNITRPAVIEADQVAADDLMLDVFVYPDGRTLVLDEAEFEQLDLPADERKSAWGAVATILAMVKDCQFPFDEIVPRES